MERAAEGPRSPSTDPSAGGPSKSDDAPVRFDTTFTPGYASSRHFFLKSFLLRLLLFWGSSHFLCLSRPGHGEAPRGGLMKES